jgi:hypothetical protein
MMIEFSHNFYLFQDDIHATSHRASPRRSSARKVPGVHRMARLRFETWVCITHIMYINWYHIILLDITSILYFGLKFEHQLIY